MLSTWGLHGLLDACCAKAATEGTTVLDILAGISLGNFTVALDGGGFYDIQSTSNAGQSVSQVVSGPGKSEIVDSIEYLKRLGASCVVAMPVLLDDPPTICDCIRSKLPKLPITSFRASYATMGPGV